jgi:hypothetical protein
VTLLFHPALVLVSGPPDQVRRWRSTKGSRGSPKSLASYEPDELPGCSTPRWCWCLGPRIKSGGGVRLRARGARPSLSPVMSLTRDPAAPPAVVCIWAPGFAGVGFEGPLTFSGVCGGPGGDLLFRALRRSTIGAEGFHGRVRDGIGCFAPRYGHQAFSGARNRGPGARLSLVPGSRPSRSELCECV